MNPEQIVAAAVVEWLLADGWEVYQEVVIPGGRADIVAVRAGIRWAIEVKTCLNFAVLDQAHRNAAYFHLSSYAVPAPAKLPHGTPGGWRFAHEAARLLRFGGLRVLPASSRPNYCRIKEDVVPRLNRRPGPVKLNEAQKTACLAGSNGGGYWTPFRQTVQELSQFVAARPGTILRNAVTLIGHHYASNAGATQCLSQMIRNGVIKDVRLEHGKLYPVTTAAL